MIKNTIIVISFSRQLRSFRLVPPDVAFRPVPFTPVRRPRRDNPVFGVFRVAVSRSSSRFRPGNRGRSKVAHVKSPVVKVADDVSFYTTRCTLSRRNNPFLTGSDCLVEPILPDSYGT